MKKIAFFILLSLAATVFGRVSTFADTGDELRNLIDKYDVIPESSITAGISTEYKPNRLIVKTSDGSIPEGYGEVKALQIAENGIYAIQYDSAKDTENAYNSIKSLSDTAIVAYDRHFNINESVPGNPVDYLSTDESPRNSHAGEQIKIAMYATKLFENNKLPEKEKRVKVAVVDSWIDTEHPMLKDYIIAPPGYPTVSEENEADFLHGTHVAGIIANAASPFVNIVPISIDTDMGKTTTSLLITAINEAVEVHAVDIINLSIAYKDIYNEYEHIKLCIDYAIAKGVLVVAAAGNNDEDTNNIIPAVFGTLEGFVTVGAVNGNNERIKGGHGEALDICAPGKDIMSTVPNGKKDHYTGTSMAAPYVSASAALLKIKNPDLTPAEMERCLEEMAEKVAGEKGFYGAGILSLQYENLVHVDISYVDQAGLTVDTQRKDMAIGSNVSIADLDIPPGYKLIDENWTHRVVGDTENESIIVSLISTKHYFEFDDRLVYKNSVNPHLMALEDSCKVTFTFIHNDLNSTANYWSIELYDTNERIYFVKPIQGDIKQTEIVVYLSPGIYSIRVRTENIHMYSSDNYKLTAYCETNTGQYEAEPNNSKESATKIALNQAVTGKLDTDMDIDLYEFKLSDAGNVSVTFEHSWHNATKYWIIEVYDAHNRTHIYIDVFGDRTKTISETRDLPPGTYYLKVSKGSFYSIDYTLTVNY